MNRGAAWLLAFAGVVAGCGPSASDPGRGVGVTRAEFASQYCSLAKPCCEGAGLPSAGCAASISSFLPPSFDGSAGDACLEAIRAKSSAPDFCANQAYLAATPACSYMTTERGKVAVGGTCNNGENGGECAASPEGQVGCVYGSPGGGVCSVQLLGAEGASGCVADSQLDGSIASGASIAVSTPPKGYYCDRTKNLHCDTGTTLCTKPSAVGGPCAYNDYECDPVAYCDTTVKKCKARIAIDGACAFPEKCTTGAYCAATGHCTASVANGGACKGDTQCVSRFCKAGSCAAGFSGSGAAGICKNY